MKRILQLEKAMNAALLFPPQNATGKENAFLKIVKAGSFRQLFLFALMLLAFAATTEASPIDMGQVPPTWFDTILLPPPPRADSGDPGGSGGGGGGGGLPRYQIVAVADPMEGTTVGGGTYYYGQNCTLIAIPNTDYIFTNWTEAGNNDTAVMNSAIYSFTVTCSRTLVANFEAIVAEYTITATANPPVAGTVNGEGTYPQGQTCTLTATANEGYEFVNWTENGEVVSSDANYSFAVTGDRALVAQFVSGVPVNIIFADDNVKTLCVANWDTNGDGELSYAEAAAVTSLGEVFSYNTSISSFDELQYFIGLTSIGNYAFSGCTDLTTIIIPNSVTSIGDIGFNVFSDCSNLEHIMVDTGNSVYDSRENCNAIINTNTNELVIGCKNTVIPNSVISIGDNAFFNCSGLTTIVIPNSVIHIGLWAFRLCIGLTSMTILSETPPSLSSNVFSFVNHSIPVNVPCGSLVAYQNAAGWSEFTNIQEYCSQQTITLSEGWNWFSTNVDITLDDLKNALVEALPGTTITIKSRNNGYATYNGSMWRGVLSSLDVTQMYMIQAGTACEITLQGIPINPVEHPVTIRPGVNWIAFPLSESMTIANAFAGFAVANDAIKSKSSNGYTTFNGTMWRGTLNTLQPGAGYIYQSNATEDRTFTFPTSAK